MGSPETGEAVQSALRGLNWGGSAELPEFLHGPPPAVPKRYWLFFVVSRLAIVCPFGMPFSGWFLVPSIVLWVTNLVLHWRFGQTMGQHTAALSAVIRLVGCVPELRRRSAALPLKERQELEVLANTADEVRKRVSLVLLFKHQTNDLLQLGVDYLNLLCLFEITSLCRASVMVKEKREDLIRLLEIVARLDASQGLARTLAQYPIVCVAARSSGAEFCLEEMYHPLVSRPVTNTFSGDGKSLVLTGTNMSGKTTFMKSVAINLLLAQTIGFCLARKAVLPAARITTLIKRDDTICTGRSYFYFEADELLRMLRAAEECGEPIWFIIDELFRGTNTIERVAAGGAVLNYLAKSGMVIASTHDHELIALLEGRYESCHFSETVGDRGAEFDYRLKKGPCPTRNAIRLLSLVGYPKEVTDQACNTVEGRIASS